jgi:hypothetical protein
MFEVASMSQRYNFSLSGLIFFGVPPTSSTTGGGGSVKGEREIRDSVSFQAREGSTKKRRMPDEPESLPSRICRTLDGLPWNGTMRGGKIKKTPIEFVWLCFNFFTITINAKNRCSLITDLDSGFWIQTHQVVRTLT